MLIGRDVLQLVDQLHASACFLVTILSRGQQRDNQRCLDQARRQSKRVSRTLWRKLVGYTIYSWRCTVRAHRLHWYIATTSVQFTSPQIMFNTNAQNTSRLIFILCARKFRWEKSECYTYLHLPNMQTFSQKDFRRLFSQVSGPVSAFRNSTHQLREGERYR